jgi:hypothetical protein
VDESMRIVAQACEWTRSPRWLLGVQVEENRHDGGSLGRSFVGWLRLAASPPCWIGLDHLADCTPTRTAKGGKLHDDNAKSLLGNLRPSLHDDTQLILHVSYHVSARDVMGRGRMDAQPYGTDAEAAQSAISINLETTNGIYTSACNRWVYHGFFRSCPEQAHNLACLLGVISHSHHHSKIGIHHTSPRYAPISLPFTPCIIAHVHKLAGAHQLSTHWLSAGDCLSLARFPRHT